MTETARTTYSGHPVGIDKHGIERFKANPIVRYLLDAGPFDMNDLAMLPFDDADRARFAQLIGYSICGWQDLSYTEEYEEAHEGTG